VRGPTRKPAGCAVSPIDIVHSTSGAVGGADQAVQARVVPIRQVVNHSAVVAVGAKREIREIISPVSSWNKVDRPWLRQMLNGANLCRTTAPVAGKVVEYGITARTKARGRSSSPNRGRRATIAASCCIASHPFLPGIGLKPLVAGQRIIVRRRHLYCRIFSNWSISTL